MFGTSPFGTAPFGAKFITDAGPTTNMGTVTITALLPTLDFTGHLVPPEHITVALTATTPTLSSTAHDSYGDNAVIVTAPVPTLSSRAGAGAALTAPAPTLSSTMTGTALLSASLSASTPTLASTGTAAYVASAALTAPVPNLVGYGGAVCSITTSAGTLSATGTGGGVARVAVTVPMAQLSAGVTAQNYGSALLVAPAGRMAPTLQAYLVAPTATLTAIGSATITATYEAYALNLNHNDPAAVDEMTHYTNFPFTHVVRYKNSYYGVAAGGLYLLEGTTDAGAPIAWQFKTGITDFGTANLKTVTYAYFGGRFGPGATVSIYPGESGGNSYSYTTPRGQAAQNYRQQFGRGLKARYFAVGASGTDALELDSLELITDTLSRRI